MPGQQEEEARGGAPQRHSLRDEEEQEPDGEGDGRPEASKVHHKEGRNVIGFAPQVLLPEALLPEPESLHVLVVVTEGRESKRGSLQYKNTYRTA